MKKAEPIGDELCKYCPLDKDKQGVYSTPGGYSAGCEGSHCTEAKQNYDDQIIQEPESVPLTAEEIRKKFETETGVTPDNSQGEPDIEYVQWLENRLCDASQFQPKEIDLKKEILNDFILWVWGETNYWRKKDHTPFAQIIDEYLNSK